MTNYEIRMTDDQKNPLLQVTGLKTHFAVGRGVFSRGQTVKAVDGVDFALSKGKTLALVGESGSGKTTVGRTLLRLIPPAAGSVNFDGQDVFSLSGSGLKKFRSRMQMIFQDPVASLNPRMTVGHIVAEPLCVHFSLTRRERRQRVEGLLRRVGLSERYINRYPHEFSGGQRQRIGIARALACEPELIVCDEPVSALDVSIQAQILNLLSDLQDELGLSYLFIAHNLAVVEHFADEIAVMYLGKIVETAPKAEVLGGGAGYGHLVHPYARALLSSVPTPDPATRLEHSRIELSGEIPSPVNPPTGCVFHPRCPLTRTQAGHLPPEQTVEIPNGEGLVRIVKRCACQTPQLTPTPNNPAHRHACLLQHE